MKSINPEDFKVTSKIELNKIQTRLDIVVDEDEKAEKLLKVQMTGKMHLCNI